VFLPENRNGRASMVTVKGDQATVTTLLDGLKQPTAIEPSVDTLWVGDRAVDKVITTRWHADGNSRCSKRTSIDHTKFLGSVCFDGAPVYPWRAVVSTHSRHAAHSSPEGRRWRPFCYVR
jgi:hypothetical protein